MSYQYPAKFGGFAPPPAPGYAGDINLDSTAADRTIAWSDGGGAFATIQSQASGDKLVLTATALSLTSTTSLQLGQTAGTDRVSVQHAAYAESGATQGVSKALSFVSTWWDSAAVAYRYSTLQGNVDVSGNPQLSLYLPGADSTTAPGTEQVRFTKDQILAVAFTSDSLPSFSRVGFPTCGMSVASDLLTLITNGTRRLTISSGGCTVAVPLSIKGADHYAIYSAAASSTRISTITANTWIFFTSDVSRLQLDSAGATIGGGTAILKSATYTLAVSAEILAGALSSQVITATGVAAGDTCSSVEMTAVQPTSIVIQSVRCGTNTVTVDFYNADLLAPHTLTGTIKVRVDEV